MQIGLQIRENEDMAGAKWWMTAVLVCGTGIPGRFVVPNDIREAAVKFGADRSSSLCWGGRANFGSKTLTCY